MEENDDVLRGIDDQYHVLGGGGGGGGGFVVRVDEPHDNCSQGG